MSFRVGRIPFLVCAPFFHDFLGRENEFSHVKFVDGPPSKHCEGLKNGFIHLSPASSIVFAQKPGAFVLSSELCTSCMFEVRSVKLFSKFPIEELSEKTIRVTDQSQTSIMLLRILLEGRYMLKPNYVPGNFISDFDAYLLIGDLALEENERNRFEYVYDLGSLWQNWHGLPFVFGAWIISKNALIENRIEIENYMEKTKESIENFKKNKTDSLNRWLSKYPVHLPRCVVEDYYRVLDYHFTEERKESLALFYEFAVRMGFVGVAPKLEFI